MPYSTQSQVPYSTQPQVRYSTPQVTHPVNRRPIFSRNPQLPGPMRRSRDRRLNNNVLFANSVSSESSSSQESFSSMFVNRNAQASQDSSSLSSEEFAGSRFQARRPMSTNFRAFQQNGGFSGESSSSDQSD